MAAPLTLLEKKRRDIQNAYIELYKSELFKIVLDDLRERSCFDQPTYMKGLESWQPAYRDGQQSLFRYILTQSTSEPNTNQTPTITKS